MKIHLRADKTNSVHTHFTVFINGQNCGQLCMGVDDAALFHQILGHGLNSLGIHPVADTFKSTGLWDLQVPEKPND